MIKPLKRIFIYASEQQEEEIRRKPTIPGVNILYSKSFVTEKEIKEFDIFFLLKKEYIVPGHGSTTANQVTERKYPHWLLLDFKGKPVIINATITTLSEAGLPDNFSRINGWPGFLERDIWEIASPDNSSISSVFETLDWKIRLVKDVPGLVAARVLSLIINEAFYALKENISTREEIDLAMKLGTNYPLGPFEWADKIGISSIFDLLTALSEQDDRYKPSFVKEGR